MTLATCYWVLERNTDMIGGYEILITRTRTRTIRSRPVSANSQMLIVCTVTVLQKRLLYSKITMHHCLSLSSLMHSVPQLPCVSFVLLSVATSLAPQSHTEQWHMEAVIGLCGWHVKKYRKFPWAATALSLAKPGPIHAWFASPAHLIECRKTFIRARWSGGNASRLRLFTQEKWGCNKGQLSLLRSEYRTDTPLYLHYSRVLIPTETVNLKSQNSEHTVL